MSFELLDFPPIFRLIDAHALWHAATIPLTVAWWTFMCNDAIELEGAQLGARGVSGVGLGADEKMPLTGSGGEGVNGVGAEERKEIEPKTPSFTQLAAGTAPPKGRSPGREKPE
jgi:hypothetical protein